MPGSRTSQSRSWSTTEARVNASIWFRNCLFKILQSQSSIRWFCFVSLIAWVSSLCYDSREFCVPASVQLKPVYPVFCVCAPRSAPHVIFIIRPLGSAQAALNSFCHKGPPNKNNRCLLASATTITALEGERLGRTWGHFLPLCYSLDSLMKYCV